LKKAEKSQNDKTKRATVSQERESFGKDPELKKKGQEHVRMKSSHALQPKQRASVTMPTDSEQRASQRDKVQTTFTLARQQPKSPEEEKMLQERYGGMSMEQRAFAILCDLGMIEKNLNPDDPDYDHSNDDEIFI
jgi:TFIIF-interacting CTD phosphatase-like protein